MGSGTRRFIWPLSTAHVRPSTLPSPPLFHPLLETGELGSNIRVVEALDHLLDQEGLEVDPINRMEKETPLHKAVQYANKEKEHGLDIVEMLIDAGADPRSVYSPLLPPCYPSFISGIVILTRGHERTGYGINKSRDQ